MTKQLTQAQQIMAMNKPFRFRLGALCALKPSEPFYPHGERKANSNLNKANKG